MNRDVKVSIILPVYNAYRYIERCLNTLINQTLKEIEIIVVLDAPTDGTDEIVKKYARSDSRIIVIENKYSRHVGFARNQGINFAKGEYLGFSDHDDYRDLEMYEKLYEQAKSKDYDLLCSPYIIQNKNNISIYKYPSNIDNIKNEICNSIIGRKSHDDIIQFPNMHIWNKIYKRSLIVENSIQFVDTRQYTAEDLLFLLEVVINSSKVGYVNLDLYYHVLRVSNTGSTLDYHSPQKVVNTILKMKNILFENNIFEKNKERFYNTIRLWILSSIAYSIKYDLKNIYSVIKLCKKHSIIKKSFECNNTIFYFYSYPKYLFNKVIRLIIK